MYDSENKNVEKQLSREEWWRLNAALASYDGYITQGDKVITAFAFLIFQALSMASKHILSGIEIQELLNNEFGADWRLGQINSAVKELLKVKFIEKVGDKDDAKYLVVEKYKNINIKQQEETSKLKKEVIDEWIDELKKRYEKLDEVKCNYLSQDLIDFCVNIFDRFGLECLSLIYPDNNARENFLSRLENESIRNLCDRGEFNTIRNFEIIGFFKKSSNTRSRFINNFFRSTILKNAIIIDPEFIGSISSYFIGSQIILDTNFLFSLLGLDGSFEEQIAKAIIDFTQNLGIKIRVHNVSISEFKRSLERRGIEIKLGKMPPPEIAKIVTDMNKQEGPISKYYERYEKTSITWDDWVKPYMAITTQLNERNIEIVNWYHDEIIKDEKYKELSKDIFDVSKDYYKEITRGRQLTIEICEHDAFILMLIEILRRGLPKEHLNSKTWCITLDTKMTRYEKNKKETNIEGTPTFILLDNWLQFVGPMNSKTEDWNMLVKKLIMSPELQSPVSELPSMTKLHQIASKLSEYKGISVHLASQILLSDRLQKSIEDIPEEEFPQKVGGIIEEALLIDIDTKEQELKNATFNIIKLEKNLESASVSAQRSNIVLSSIEGQLKDVEKQMMTNQKNIRMFFSILMFALLSFVALLVDWGKLNTISFTLLIIAMIIGVTSIIGLLKNWHIAWNILMAIAAIISLAAAIVTFRLM